MFNLMWTYLQIRFSMAANYLIHFLKQVPVLKKIIPASLYKEYTLKMIFSAFGIVLIATKKILCRFIYVGFIILLGVFLHYVNSMGGFFRFFNFGEIELSFSQNAAKQVIPFILNSWLMFSLFGAIINARVVNASPYDDIMINYLRANPAAYAKSCILFERIVDLCLYLPYFLIVCTIADISFWSVFIISVVFTAIRLLGESLNILLFYREIKRQYMFNALAGLFTIFGAIVIPGQWGVLDWTAVFQSFFIAAIFMVIGIIAALYMKRYPRYFALFKISIAESTELIKKAEEVKKYQKHPNLQDAKDWSKHVGKEDLKLGSHDKKSGFAYLNAIFFDRHSKFFRKKLRLRSLIILMVCAMISLLSMAYTLYSGNPPIKFSQNFIKLINNVPVFFFIIYLTSMGKVVTASIFSNCDIQMLHYSYYRTKENIFASFKARFLYIIRCNFQITTVMFAGTIVSVWFLIGYMDFIYAGVFFVLLTCMGLFFAFNDLFLYYVIQPYDTEGQAKSIIYSIINGVIYLIAYMNLNMDFNFITYSIFMIIATILYLGIGTGLLLLFAPKNFRLR